MVQPALQLDLAEEPLGADRLGELGPQRLDRHMPARGRLGEKDAGHATLPEQALHGVTSGKPRSESVGERAGHWRSLSRRGSG
jgi:hypothetical protein